MTALQIDWSLSLPFLFSIVTAAVAWFLGRRKDVDAKFLEGSRRMDRINGRVEALEQKVESMPATSDLHQVQLTLTEMAGSLSTMSERLRSQTELMRRLENVVTRHEDHLLDKSK